jgi:hypothetical protein
MDASAMTEMTSNAESLLFVARTWPVWATLIVTAVLAQPIILVLMWTTLASTRHASAETVLLLQRAEREQETQRRLREQAKQLGARPDA